MIPNLAKNAIGACLFWSLMTCISQFIGLATKLCAASSGSLATPENINRNNSLVRGEGWGEGKFQNTERSIKVREIGLRPLTKPELNAPN
jgi:hypothetical protein